MRETPGRRASRFAGSCSASGTASDGRNAAVWPGFKETPAPMQRTLLHPHYLQKLWVYQPQFERASDAIAITGLSRGGRRFAPHTGLSLVHAVHSLSHAPDNLIPWLPTDSLPFPRRCFITPTQRAAAVDQVPTDIGYVVVRTAMPHQSVGCQPLPTHRQPRYPGRVGRCSTGGGASGAVLLTGQ